MHTAFATLHVSIHWFHLEERTYTMTKKLQKFKINSRVWQGLLAIAIAAAGLFFVTTRAQAAGPAQSGPTELETAINMMWVMLAGALVFFMQAGFALVETGFTRNKNVAHTMMMNMMVFCIGAVAYWAVGFAFQFGGVNHTFAEINGHGAWAFSPITLGDWTGVLDKPLLIGDSSIMGLTGFFLGGVTANTGVLVFFFFQMVFMDTAATIPTGSMAERVTFLGFVIMSVWVCAFIYPVVAGWIWGGGWVANLGRTMGWGNGAVDFAGSGPVHMIGGAVALAGALALGPRIGKYNSDGSANVIPGHSISLGVLGTIILFFGWLGFNPGSSLGFIGGFRNLAVLAAVNTLIAGAVGGVTAMTYVWLFTPVKKPDPASSVNGLLAGLVAVTAPSAFIEPWAAAVIGLIAGVWVIVATGLLDRFKIDDPVGAIPVHLANGMLGVLAVGIFASGNPDTAAWNGVDSAVTGLLYGGGVGQLLAQGAEAGAILVVVTGLSYVVFKALMAAGILRVSAEVELQGLDIPEMGTLGYPPDWEPTPQQLKDAGVRVKGMVGALPSDAAAD
jgi:ammonium transporter, Amt family